MHCACFQRALIKAPEGSNTKKIILSQAKSCFVNRIK